MYLISGSIIEQLCDVQPDECGQLRSYADKNNMVRAARTLLSSVTRVLLLADTVVVKQLLEVKERVSILKNFVVINNCRYLKYFCMCFSHFKVFFFKINLVI